MVKEFFRTSKHMKAVMDIKKGFTFVEIAISIAIASILLYCSSYSLKNSFDLRNKTLLDSAASELLGDVKLAQMKAMEEGRIYHIYLNSLENSYMVYCFDNVSTKICKYKKLPDTIHYDKFRSTYKNNKISFNSRGKPLPYPCTVSLKDDSGEYRKVTISVGTDYIRINDS